jgi:hypothetical protein
VLRAPDSIAPHNAFSIHNSIKGPLTMVKLRPNSPRVSLPKELKNIELILHEAAEEIGVRHAK